MSSTTEQKQYNIMTESTSDRLRKKRLDRVRRTVELADLMIAMTPKKAQPEIEETTPDNEPEVDLVAPIMPYTKKALVKGLSVQEKEWYIQIRVREMRKRLLKERKERQEEQKKKMKMWEMYMMMVQELGVLGTDQKEAEPTKIADQINVDNEVNEYRRVIEYGSRGALWDIGGTGRGDGKLFEFNDAFIQQFRTTFEQYFASSKNPPIDQALLQKLERTSHKQLDINSNQSLERASKHIAEINPRPDSLPTFLPYNHLIPAIKEAKLPDRLDDIFNKPRPQGREAFLQNMRKKCRRLWRVVKNRFRGHHTYDEWNDYAGDLTDDENVDGINKSSRLEVNAKKGRLARGLQKLGGFFKTSSKKASPL